ncbi:unnamed protein product [Darwinula stevensoni]|uniref:PHD-type domain-containing protein n=1 Tax=Darwinula stevensoni TaxID=69355 RepID=A0A7R9FQD0_9CRUS|nr:unnamed protein product [Darwinula stevensoni]CAG0899510.1 unnamed protein product [Darwinula stevensoni]
MSMTTEAERDPQKRRVKPTAESLIGLEILAMEEDSDDDSDFKIEGGEEEEEDDDVATESEESSSASDQDDDNVMENACEKPGLTVGDILEKAEALISNSLAKGRDQEMKEMPAKLICCVCLGDATSLSDEIIECDGCGVSVHEGGIFKETDVGKWVHLVCALFVPGVAFGDPERLAYVTLFEINYGLWGAKPCCICSDTQMSRTGVCIGCDAGLCKTHFHVTCAQREGLLHYPHDHGMTAGEQADLYYAHCRLHSDRNYIRMKKGNWMALEAQIKRRLEERKSKVEVGLIGPELDQGRLIRKLRRHRMKYEASKENRSRPQVLPHKLGPRAITTSASAVRRFRQKAELMGIPMASVEASQEQMQSLGDVHRKWHIPPAFTVEFVAYYLDRNRRLMELKKTVSKLASMNESLQKEERSLRKIFEEVSEKHSKVQEHDRLVEEAQGLQAALCHLSGREFPLPQFLSKSKQETGSSLSPDSLKDSKKSNKKSRERKSIFDPLPPKDVGPGLKLLTCHVCKSTKDQHFLVTCDTCHSHYHIGCLDPPLTRMPKKTRLYGW